MAEVQPLRLFDLPDLPWDAPEPARESYTRRLTRKRRSILAAGFNPGSHRALLDPEWGYRCKDCTHCVPSGRNRVYWKCDINPRGITGGPATDIRLKWGACTALRMSSDG